MAFDLAIQQVAKNAYALIGSTGGRTYENFGLNANLGFIITSEGVVLIDSGSGSPAAHLVEKTVRKITDKPIRWVINTGSQDHRWLGNSYFSSQGAQIIALARTVKTQQAHATEETSYLADRLKDHFGDTQPLTAPNPVPDDQGTLVLGNRPFQTAIAPTWII
ncbi:MBL fold metallo-hydrolase [Thiolapillus brandeum]|uniref:MBL fold metallo-hydrolase n=1 Tax=Thiolapillus brandeum TaxID=1076588 RepID=UPI001186B724|nr:MBL fold metallo-hydrolase [Thiolapillus brandeum]